MKKARFFIALTVFSLTAASLACTVFIGGPDYPATSVAVSTEAVGSLDQQVQAAQTAAVGSGILTLAINESQITSLLAAKLSAQTDPFMRDPQVLLRNGEIQVYGKAKQGYLEANIRIVLSATIDAEGKPVITVTSADFGPLPSPEGLNSTFSAFMGEAFTGTLGPAAFGFRLENITIADGVMTLTGRVK